MPNLQRKDRTLNMTVDDLLQSARLNIAVERFKDDPMLLKAILIELGLECLNVAKHRIIREYSKHSAFAQFEMIPYLKSINDFKTFNIYFPLSELEKRYYMADPKNQLSPEERKELFNKIKKKLMGE